MAQIIQFVRPAARAAESSWEQNWKARNTEDGTNQLLRTGIWTLAAGIAATVLAVLVFDGFTAQGPHSSVGWLWVMLAFMTLPFGIMVSALGLTKSLRNRHLVRATTSTSETSASRR